MMAPVRDAGFHGVQRRLAALLPEGRWIDAPPTLELTSLGAQDAPRLIAAPPLEGTKVRAHDVTGAVEPRFAAFLDGTQTSKTMAHVNGAPIVHGTAAAVIRQRVEGRLRTWDAPRVSRALYAPLGMLPPEWREALQELGLPIVEIMTQQKEDSPHPFALQDAAIHAVQVSRERIERELAERWCGGSDIEGELYVDGPISGSEAIATSGRGGGGRCAIGVVKSHRTLYADGDVLRVVLRLERGQRSSVFRITSPRRTPVASWYLRLRDTGGRDPLWGLVRVEMPESRAAGTTAIAARADEVSRWVLAEALPLAVPDGRWDKMVYGIRDCEEFLKSIQ